MAVAKKKIVKKTVAKKPVKVAAKTAAKKPTKVLVKKIVKAKPKAAAKPAVKKAVVKKPVAKKQGAKKPVVKKAVSKKPVAKKAVKAVAKKTVKAVVKKLAKPVAKKKAAPLVKKPVAKKTVKVVAKETLIKKPAAKAAPAQKKGPAGPPEHMRDAFLAVLDERQAEEILTIDLSGRSSMADYLIIASGRSSRQIAAIADYLRAAVQQFGIQQIRIEGLPEANWVLVDAGDVIVHLFRPEVRGYYNLENIWDRKDGGDAAAKNEESVLG